VLLINATNWLDGIDGLSGGVSIISASTILVLSLRSEVNQPPIAIICSIFIGAVLGFLIFNFNPAKIMAGTSGSMFMGFMLAVMAIFAGTKIATALLVMAIPVIDSVWVITERIRKKRSIFRPDKAHLHFKLLDLGWSQKKICFYYYVITVIIAAIALNTRVIGKSITLFLAVLFMTSVSFIINKKLRQTEGNLPN
jgi:UDP-GlcNAc:undecaprenyl-phosphate GlcNAc-1-phosphate transferase